MEVAGSSKILVYVYKGACCSVVVKTRAPPVGRLRDQLTVVSLGTFSVVPSDKTMCPEVDLTSENEYQEFLLG
jgi:hypothetical protein